VVVVEGAAVDVVSAVVTDVVDAGVDAEVEVGPPELTPPGDAWVVCPRHATSKP
jgi:hypothetical protein